MFVILSIIIIILYFIIQKIDKSIVIKLWDKFYPYINFLYIYRKFLFSENDLYQMYEQFTRNLKSPRLLYAIGFTHVFIDKPEDLKIALNSALDRPHFYTFAHNEAGLITAKESVWKVHRKLLNSSFNLKVLQSFFPIFNDKIDIFMNTISENHEYFNIGPYCSRLALDTVCATSFGWNSEVQQGKHQKYLEAANGIPDILFKRVINLFLHSDFIYKFTQMYKEEKKHFDFIYKMTWAVIAGKREEYNKEIQNESNSDKGDTEDNYNTPQVLVKQLLKLHFSGQITEKHLFDHCDTIIGAGTETSSSVLSNSILLLAMHPEIQELVYQELRSVFPEQQSYVGYDEIGKLFYLEMVIKETMRLFTPVPATARKANSDIILSNGFKIKKGHQIFILFTNLHENPNIWGNNPKVFNPENFLPEKIENRHPYSYLPFGGGPRICIGQRYAIFFLKTALAKILRQYRFTTEQRMETIKKQYGVTIKLSTKHYVKLHKRDYV